MTSENLAHARRTTIEDAIRAANLESYVFNKKENDGQSQVASRLAPRTFTTKTAESNNNWRGSDQVTSKLIPPNSANTSKNSSVSALYALFQQEIQDMEKTEEPRQSTAESKQQAEDLSLSNLEKRKKKTRWEKPSAVPQMSNTNILGSQQQQMHYNPTNFNQTGIYQTAKPPISNPMQFGGLGFNGNNLLGSVLPNIGFLANNSNLNSQMPQSAGWGGYSTHTINTNKFTTNKMNNNFNTNLSSSQNQKKESIEGYVRRALERCRGEKERQLTEKALKKIIDNAKMKGEYETRNWDTFPLPNITTENKFSNNPYISNFQDAHDNNDNQRESWDINSYDNAGPIQVGAILAKRGFNAINPDDSRLEIGVNAKGKKVIKTLNKAANKARLELTREEEERRKQRQGRFHEDLSKKTEFRHEDVRPYRSAELDAAEEGDDLETLAEKWKVVGTSTALEKPYLRLTKEPDPSMVRPEHILKKSLKMVLDKWKNKEVSYPYVAEQFRSIRQDLTVQHIKNEFVVKVYEANARISLESHDVKYFNQCQSWLRDLYQSGIPSKNKPEFFCYRIIHLTLCDMKNELNQTLLEISPEDMAHEYIKFALDIRRNMENGNVKGVFNLYKNGINLTSYLIDIFIHRVRIWALQIITKSYGDKTPLNFLSDILAFNTEEDFREFLKKSSGVLNEEEDSLLNKESYKVYSDHPWMKMKLQTYKASHG